MDVPTDRVKLTKARTGPMGGMNSMNGMSGMSNMGGNSGTRFNGVKGTFSSFLKQNRMHHNKVHRMQGWSVVMFI